MERRGNKFRDFLNILGMICAMGFTSVLAFAFYTAYSSPLKMVGIYIDSVGEAEFEFYFVGVAVLLVFYSLIYNMKRYDQRKRGLK